MSRFAPHLDDELPAVFLLVPPPRSSLPIVTVYAVRYLRGQRRYFIFHTPSPLVMGLYSPLRRSQGKVFYLSLVAPPRIRVGLDDRNQSISHTKSQLCLSKLALPPALTVLLIEGLPTLSGIATNDVACSRSHLSFSLYPPS